MSLKWVTSLRSICLILAVIAGLAVPALAEPEVHVVGIYEGFDRSNGQIHGPKARVLLDRPGAEVVLILSSAEATLWEVTLAEGTEMPSVVLSQGSDDRQGAVMVNGQALDQPVRMGLPLAYRPEGQAFRALAMQVTDRFGVDRMASFAGEYRAEEMPFHVFEVVDDPNLDPDRLESLVSIAEVPPSLLSLIGPPTPATPPEVELTGAGFQIRGGDGAPHLIPLPLEMPAVGRVAGAVRDARTGTIYGATRDREGLLYAHDEATGTWRIAREMDGMRPQALFLDEAGQRLIMPLDQLDFGKIALLDLTAGEVAPMQIVDLRDGLVGLSDLYEPGNSPEPPLVPLGIADDRLLLMASTDRQFFVREDLMVDAGPVWRAWLADLSSGRVTLVGYGDGEAAVARIAP